MVCPSHNHFHGFRLCPLGLLQVLKRLPQRGQASDFSSSMWVWASDFLIIVFASLIFSFGIISCSCSCPPDNLLFFRQIIHYLLICKMPNHTSACCSTSLIGHLIHFFLKMHVHVFLDCLFSPFILQALSMKLPISVWTFVMNEFPIFSIFSKYF